MKFVEKIVTINLNNYLCSNLTILKKRSYGTAHTSGKKGTLSFAPEEGRRERDKYSLSLFLKS